MSVFIKICDDFYRSLLTLLLLLSAVAATIKQIFNKINAKLNIRQRWATEIDGLGNRQLALCVFMYRKPIEASIFLLLRYDLVNLMLGFRHVHLF